MALRGGFEPPLPLGEPDVCARDSIPVSPSRFRRVQVSPSLAISPRISHWRLDLARLPQRRSVRFFECRASFESRFSNADQSTDYSADWTIAVRAAMSCSVAASSWHSLFNEGQVAI